MLQSFFMSLGLVFIFEGMLPFLVPRLWRRMMHNMLMQNEKTLRRVGFVSMLMGLGVLYLLRNLS